ncbi:MAG: DUF1273 family protein [Clostridia bacterium]|nr:DUF1273 family protein [Clostridia bacterium]
MEQLRVTDNTIETPKTCAFTGHRELGKDFSARKLKIEIKALIEKGVDTFYNGMAVGFDLIAAETVLAFKRRYKHIKLIACIPCPDQDKYFSDRDKKRYVKVCQAADERVVLFERYTNYCMQARDRYMAERADVLITYCKKDTGGTAYTVRYFKKIHAENEIIFI